jgi:predicted rRNA methylase YqxC with S4 and FtsJ domains
MAQVLVSKLLVEMGFCKSMSMARRAVFMGAVKHNGKVLDTFVNIDAVKGDTITVGRNTKEIA